jgi:hypothetical protein
MLFLPSASMAEEYVVVKGDTLRVSVFQWPEYSGESRVDDLGSISLPALGRSSVSGLNLTTIEQRIVEKLSRVSRISNPRVVVDVVEFRPFSVLGAVNNPGRYPYTSGTTVLDAVAVSGGFLSLSAMGRTFKGLIDLRQRQEGLDVLTFQLWGATARRARLLAEHNDLEKIEFPADLIEFQEANNKSRLSKREEEIFAVRKKIIDNQIEIFQEQTKILDKEIKILDTHRSAIRRSVKFLSDELKNQNTLLDKGLVRRLTVITVEKQLTDMQGEYRQSVVSAMKARKDLSNIKKQIALIQNRRRAEISNELLAVESDIAIFLKKIEYQKSLLYDNVVSVYRPADASNELAEGVSGFDFVILRGKPDAEKSVIPATESTPIMPGDVLKVVLSRSEVLPPQPNTH